MAKSIPKLDPLSVHHDEADSSVLFRVKTTRVSDFESHPGTCAMLS